MDGALDSESEHADDAVHGLVLPANRARAIRGVVPVARGGCGWVWMEIDAGAGGCGWVRMGADGGETIPIREGD